MPATIPESLFTDQVTLLFGPPSVPRSVSALSRQSAACRFWFPAKLEKPASQPRLLILLARLFVPPSEGRSVMEYCGWDAANPKQIAIKKSDAAQMVFAELK